MNIRDALAKVVDKFDLSRAEMAAVMTEIMTGQATEAQIGAFLIALRMKGESLDEITGAAEVMRKLATKVEVDAENLVDTCGTGGDGAHLFNVSTAAAFVVAAAGGHVAKHGNRSVSSATGSADVLEAAGVNLQLTPEQVARAIKQIGVGFMFAPAHHGAMKYAIGARREIGLRTIFNLLGPMTNPAGVKRQIIGVFDPVLCRSVAEVLGRLGSEHVMVVHSADGLDELSIAAPTHIAEFKNNEVTEYVLDPTELGLGESSLEGLTAANPQQSLVLIRAAFAGETGETAARARAMIALNAGAAIYVAGLATTLAYGVAMAEDALACGAAAEKLKELIEFSSACSN